MRSSRLTVVHQPSWPLLEVEASDSGRGRVPSACDQLTHQGDVLVHHRDLERSDTWLEHPERGYSLVHTPNPLIHLLLEHLVLE